MPEMWWEEASEGHAPTDAVVCGQSVSGEKLYVGRAVVEGDLVPGRIQPSQGVCYVGNNGNEYAVQSYEVLVCKDTDKLEWVAACDGTVPSGAIVGGKVTASSEQLYVARAVPPTEPGCIYGGKLQSSHGCTYVAFGGREQSMTEYDVLCEKSSSCSIL